MIIKRPEISHVPALKAIFAEAFGESEEFLDLFYSKAFSSERALAVFDADEPLSAIYWFDVEYHGKRAAYLYALATKREARGRGLAKMLMEELHALLKDMKYSASILVPATPELFCYYRGIGYLDACGIGEQVCVSDGTSIFLEQIDLSSYLARRRELLPYDAVIEEGAAASLLENWAKFYTGAGVLLAAGQNGSRLLGIELLGDLSRAPAILTSLGYTEGIFRYPGEDRPFAMYLPLAEDVPPPSHLGFALDI